MLFPFVYCGLIDGSGCGKAFYNVETSYVGISSRGGYNVKKYKIIEPFRCSDCGRLSEFVFVKVDDDPENMTIDLCRELLERVEVLAKTQKG